MKEANWRMTGEGKPPVPSQIAAWIGKDAYQFWKRITESIEQNYPGVFNPDWLFGGKKQGWALRYKKGKSFCTLIPEKDRLTVQVVFGAEERERVEAIRHELSSRTLEQYDRAATYHDGKWLFLAVDHERGVADLERLLAAKRKPPRRQARESLTGRGKGG
jgi:hypothetical protein